MKLKTIFTNVLNYTLYLFHLDPQPHNFNTAYHVAATYEGFELFVENKNSCLLCSSYLKKLSPPSSSLYLVFSTKKPKNNLPHFLIHRHADGHLLYDNLTLYSLHDEPTKRKDLSLYVYSAFMSNLLLFPPSSTIYIYLLPR